MNFKYIKKISISFSILFSIFLFPLFILSCEGEAYNFTTQGQLIFDEVGNIEARITNKGIKDDSKITKNSVFILYITKPGAILDKETAMEKQGGTWGCPHGRLVASTTEEEAGTETADQAPEEEVEEASTEDAEPTATDKNNCIAGVGFTNDPGFAPDDKDHYTGRTLHPIEDLNTSVSQWEMEVFSTESHEVPSKYLHDYNHFQSLGTPRHEDDRFDAYMTVYYNREDSLVRNPIIPDRISPKVSIKAKFTPDEPGDVPGNIYELPDYSKWKKVLKDLY